ncbi:MAG: PEGA domain-containing protein [Bacteroidales bacterium]|nr:PEGA domain-containing protein [Bacteroidales bacterium]
MKRPVLTLFLLLACLLPVSAQQMRVEEFGIQHRPLWKRAEVPVDKASALLDFITDEKGFSFFSGAKKPAAAEEGEGVITVALPHKTAYVTIKHPEYGQLVWRVPDGKYLKRRKHYQALLIAVDPTKDYKSPKQWVVFHISPSNALLQLDSVTRPVRQETLEYYLPVGSHSYRIEAPFHEAVEDVFTLSDSVRTDIRVTLQPFYSFLSVKMPASGGDLFVDGTPIRKEEATSYRLAEGYHRVALFREERCWYDSLLFVGRAEKKVLELSERDLSPRDLRKTDPVPVMAPLEPLEAGEENAGQPALEAGSNVRLSAADARTEIWVDRERKGLGQWEGALEPGFHLAQTLRDGRESAATWLWIEDDFPQEINLSAPGTGYGLLNIHSNVTGAGIRIDGKDFGQTPQLVRLDATKSYEVTLSKPGFKPRTKTVRPRGNNQVDVYLKMKKK